MPLIRGHHSFDHSFTQIPNDWVRDSRLSLKARGLLTLLLSHSEGWSLSVKTLANQNPEGSHAIREAIHELERVGYLSREQENEGGKFGESVWVTKDPLCDYPTTENPTSENPVYKNTNDKKTNIKKRTPEESPRTPLEGFEAFWDTYPLKRDKRAAIRAYKAALSRATAEQILAGAQAYKDDPTRKPDFTKYPASWLNADSWENSYQPVDDSAKLRREKEKERSDEYLRQVQELERKSVPMPPEIRKQLGLGRE
jgi:hypothetical protein